MSKMKDFAITLDEIIEAGDELVASYKKTASTAEIILNAVKELKALFTDNTPAIPEQAAPKTAAKPLFDPTPAKTEAPKEEAKTYTFTEVRGIMAGLSGQGKKAEAKALLEKFGATRLSDVKEEDYPALVREAQVIANG